jgi:glycosyltransferase involved in cell wall biosynthesis
MTKVSFLVPTLAGGGAERVVQTILRKIDRSSFEPALILFERKIDSLGGLPEDIKIKVLKDDGNRWSVLFRLIRLLRQDPPEVLVSFLWYPNALALLTRFAAGRGLKVIVSERVASFHLGVTIGSIMRNLVIKWLYPKADLIIVPAQAMADDVSAAPRERVVVIHNPVDISHVTALSVGEADHPWFGGDLPLIIGIGRLGRQKGFDYLIRAVALLRENGVPCRLAILGDGPERGNLKSLIEQSGLREAVVLLGFQQNPYTYLARSTVFVLSSLYEGFPNVLLEALSLGVPSVATRCPTGPEEIITDGVNGLLVSPADEKALAAALERLLRDRALRERLGTAGKERAKDFDGDRIVRKFEKAIERVCA